MNSKTITLIFRNPEGAIEVFTKPAIPVPGEPGTFETTFHCNIDGSTVLGNVFNDTDYGLLKMAPCEELTLFAGDDFHVRMHWELRRSEV